MTHTFELNGIECIAEYEINSAEPEIGINRHVEIFDIKRKRDGKSIMHLLDRVTEDKYFVEGLEEEILEYDECATPDFDIYEL